MSFGIDVYLDDKTKILDSTRMGIAFILDGTGNYTYNTKPNSFSQNEFPVTTILNNFLTVSESYILSIMKNKSRAGELTASCEGYIEPVYINNHLSSVTKKGKVDFFVLGLSNIIRD